MYYFACHHDQQCLISDYEEAAGRLTDPLYTITTPHKMKKPASRANGSAADSDRQADCTDF
jgi:hypothetical protein